MSNPMEVLDPKEYSDQNKAWKEGNIMDRIGNEQDIGQKPDKSKSPVGTEKHVFIFADMMTTLLQPDKQRENEHQKEFNKFGRYVFQKFHDLSIESDKYNWRKPFWIQ